MSFQSACQKTWDNLDFKEQAQIVNRFVDMVNDFESSLFYSKGDMKDRMVGRSYKSALNQPQQRHERFFCSAIRDFFGS